MSPTRDEHGIYTARNAALRSLDLSRQVGAALITKAGELIALGCNEVPSPNGGSYWDGDPNDDRDYKRLEDQNDVIKRSLLVDLMKRLKQAELVSEKVIIEEIPQLVSKETAKGGRLRDSQLMDLLEFGRIIHAEMAALCEAARLGKAVQESTLFCTTFPCHMCAKHIVAAGIKRVVYIEPYPKSYAEHLHGDAIHVGFGASKGKVVFEPFIGIAPFRYRDLFERGRRKDDSGRFEEWVSNERRVTVRYTVPSYIQNEAAVAKLYDDATDKARAAGRLR